MRRHDPLAREDVLVTVETTEVGFHRVLPDHITVAVEGVFTDLDADDPVPSTRAAARVVVTMPDFYADTLAHLIADAWHLAHRLGGAGYVGPPERALAEALYAASTVAGYRCPRGGLQLPDEGEVRPLRA
jgi:hypothetical protein